jgi:hypothetical protein
MAETIDFWNILRDNVSFPIRGWFYFVTPEESTPAPFHIYPNALELSTNLFGIAILIEMVIISTGVFKTGRFRFGLCLFRPHKITQIHF